MDEARRRRVLGWSVAGAGLAVIVALVALLLVWGGDGDDDGPVAGSTSTTSPSSTSSSSTSTTAAGPVFPDTVVAYSNKGRLVELDTATGQARRVIAELTYNTDSYPGLGGVAATSDGQTVFYDAADGLWQVARSGGTPRRISERASLPSLSPDGKTLAYSRADDMPVLVLRDVASGKERVLGRAKDRGPDVFFSLSWAPDSRHLAVYMGWEGGNFLKDIDTQTAKVVDDGPFVKYPKGTGQGDDFRRHVWASASTFLAVHMCCVTEDEDSSMLTDKLEWSRLAMVSSTGGFDGDKLDVGKHEVTSLSRDAKGNVLYVLDGKELWAWDGSAAAPKRMGTDFVGAVWVG